MDSLNRQLPVSYEAEQSVLGSILIKPECFGDIMNYVSGEDFYVDAHKEIFYAMFRLFAASREIDYVTVTDSLVSGGKLDSDQAKEAIAKIVTAVPTAANAVDYAKIVRDRSLRRNLITICAEITESARSETDTAAAILEAAEAKIYGLSDKNIVRNFRSIKDVLIANYHHLQELKDHPDKLAGVPTGFGVIDKLLVGMGPGDMVLVGARPGVGKTSFTMNVATRAARSTGKAVCVFSLEMSAEQLVMRMVSTEARIDNYHLRAPAGLQVNDWKALAAASSSLSECNILIDDTPGMSVTAMKSKLRRVKNLGLVVIDYLQLMQGETKTDNRAQEVGEISRGIKLMAKEFGCPVLTCAQLNRAVEGRKDGVPMLSDLRDSGSIEQDADSVMFLHKKENETQKVQVIIAKNRHGATGTVELGWTPEFTAFHSIESTLDDGTGTPTDADAPPDGQ
ncbi:MAG: replicative DNA helicase [Clostridia bacterium]|nr:replicative DNA helicase [Clostridia bacterium]